MKSNKQNEKFAHLHNRFVLAATKWKNAKTCLTDIGLEAKQAGVSRKLAISWLEEAGWSTNWATQVVSQVWVAANGGEKSEGAKNSGRRVSPRAVELFKYAVKKFGKDAESLLLAASRYAHKLASEKPAKPAK